jgi:hypothetical protein
LTGKGPVSRGGTLLLDAGEWPGLGLGEGEASMDNQAETKTTLDPHPASGIFVYLQEYYNSRLSKFITQIA